MYFVFLCFYKNEINITNNKKKKDYSNYRPISLLSNIDKIIEKLMYKRLYTFLNNNIICNWTPT